MISRKSIPCQELFFLFALHFVENLVLFIVGSNLFHHFQFHACHLLGFSLYVGVLGSIELDIRVTDGVGRISEDLCFLLKDALLDWQAHRCSSILVLSGQVVIITRHLLPLGLLLPLDDGCAGLELLQLCLIYLSSFFLGLCFKLCDLLFLDSIGCLKRDHVELAAGMIASLLLQPSPQNSWINLRLVAILGVVNGLLIWSLSQNLSKSIFLLLNLRQLLIRLGRELIVRASSVEYANSKIPSRLCKLLLDFGQALSFLAHLQLQTVLRWHQLDLFGLHLDR